MTTTLLSTPSIARLSLPSLRRGDTLTDARLAIMLLVVGALPLLWPSVPPLTDLPNHMSRYRIGLDYATSPYFRQWFDFHWVLVGNLGVDLLVTALAPLIGLEPATKLVVLLSPLTTIAGAVLIAREVHGRVPATTAIAAVFAYNWAFNFGFVNFTLSAGLALLSFGIWLRLGRLGHHRLRAGLFVPIGFLVWLCHAAGWGILGLLIFSWEAADGRSRCRSWTGSAWCAAVQCLVLTLPLVPMLFWSSRLPSGSMSLFLMDPFRKVAILALALREGMPLADLAGSLFVLGLVAVTLLRRGFRYEKRLAATAAVLMATFLVMPVNLMGSGHADLRVAPYAILLFLVALAPTVDTRLTRTVGTLAILFFVSEMSFLTVRYAAINRAQEHQLEALDHLPIGSPVFALSRVSCSADMAGNRMDHVHRLAIVRRAAFTNGTWPYPASQTLIVKPRMVAGYLDENSQLLDPADCRQSQRHTVAGALRTIPRDRYRYFWLLDTPQGQWPSRSWLRPVWHNDRTILYAVAPPHAGFGKRGSIDRVPARRLPINAPGV